MILKTQRDVINKAEKRMIKRLYNDFVKLWKSINKYLINLETQRWWQEDVNQIIELSRAKSEQWLTEDLRDLYKLWARYIKKLTDWWVDLSLINLKAIKRIQDIEKIQSKFILETSQEEAKRVIADWIFDWKSYTQIAEDIITKTSVWFLSPKRAELIAINTVGNAYEQWRKEAVQQLKNSWMQVRKYRSTVNDDKVTEECKENQDKWWIWFNEAWPSWDTEAPRQKNPRCRCTTNYEVI